MTPRSISVPLTQRYHQVFSFAVRLSPILLSAFSPTSLGSNLYGHPFIQHTISLVGGIYACQKPGLLTLSKSEKKDLMSQWSTLRNCISKELQGVRRRETDVVLTSALLSSFVEVFFLLSRLHPIFSLNVFVQASKRPVGVLMVRLGVPGQCLFPRVWLFERTTSPRPKASPSTVSNNLCDS